MIRLYGVAGGREHHAAIRLREELEKAWPGVATSDENDELVCIASDVKLSGYSVSDIDIVVAARLLPGRAVRIKAKKLAERLGMSPSGMVGVRNFVAAVEVKDQSEGGVRFSGDKVEVRYSRGGKTAWKSATDQNIQQLHSLREYLSDCGVEAFVYRALVLQGIGLNPTVGSLSVGFSWADFIECLLQTVPNLGSSREVRSVHPAKESRLTATRIFRHYAPTAIDRRRMDRLTRKGPNVDLIVQGLGERLTYLTGHGGTGKTVTMLQAAYASHLLSKNRCLILTFNQALASDIRRLLALMNIPSGEDGGILVLTAMAFFYSWLFRLRLATRDDSDFSTYGAKCEEACQYLYHGAISAKEISDIKIQHPDKFDFDIVMVDEAQDWPSYEVRLLKKLYDQNFFVISDGIDQLIRGGRADWLAGVPRDSRKVVTLVRALRMKRNLAVFASCLADAVGVDFDVVPNEGAGGGRVILVGGCWESQQKLHRELMDESIAAGNEPIDWLICVPSDRDADSEHRVATALREWDHDVWDGTCEVGKKDFPRSTSQYRIINYRSCRGLEGWTVILDELDVFWSECFEAKVRQGLSQEERDSMICLEDQAALYAWRWVFIALTRPMDSLVITLRDRSSALSSAIMKIAGELPDIVEDRL